MKFIKPIISGVLMFFALLLITVAVNLPVLLLISIIATPIAIYFIYSKNLNAHKYLNIALIVIMIVSFIGCGSQSGSTDDSQEQNITNNYNEENVVDSNATANGEIHFIDTGNSDSILIKQGEKAVLIDGAENDDENLIVDYLKNKGVSTLSYIIATHPHADHIGALDNVINNIKVENLLVANGSADTKTYTDFINAAANKKLNPSVPLDGARFELGNNSYFEIYNTNGGSDTNEQSLVTLYVNGNDKFLFMGDGGIETEREIIDKLPDVDLLKVGHHGSKGSTEESFLDKVNPEYAVITVGKDNTYGHPHKLTMDKLKARDIIVYRTDENGTIVFNSTGNGISTSSEKGSYAYRDSNNTNSAASEEVKEQVDQSNKQSTGNTGGSNENSTQGSGSSGGSSSNSSSGSNGVGTSNSNGSSTPNGGGTSSGSGSSNSGGNTTGSNSGSNTTGDNDGSSNSEESKQPVGGTVYWTPSGKSYHSTKSCPTLSNSKTILSGTLQESGKTDPCDKCVK